MTRYYSQFKQDFIIDGLFNKKQKGVFIDIGAHDGITYSNSYFFEKNRDWKGICVEPIPEVFEKLKKNRNCILVQGAISDSNEKMKFTRCHGHTEMLSGLSKYRDEQHDVRTQKSIEQFGGEVEEIEVQAYTLLSLLTENAIKSVDYCSIDTEGGEYFILKSLDLESLDIKTFSIECNYGNNEIVKYLKSKGYYFICTAGCDSIFMKSREFRIWNVLRNYSLLIHILFSWMVIAKKKVIKKKILR